MKAGKFDAVEKTADSPRPWPAWARTTVTLLIAFHALAVWTGAWRATPSSPLERGLAEPFAGYDAMVDAGFAYRFYVNPAPTPVVTATIRYADGRTEEVRLPGKTTRPRLLVQRELALAHHLFEDVNDAQEHTGDASVSVWAKSYARHLGKTHPGARTVTLSMQLHEYPVLERVVEQLRETGRLPDLDDAAQFFSVPVRIGEFPCDAS